jgi:hypothetical protein
VTRFGDADFNTLLADMGRDTVYSGVTVKGIMDELPWDGMGTQYQTMSGTHRSILVKAGALSPVQGGTITHDGNSYTVIDVSPEAIDGLGTRIWVKG